MLNREWTAAASTPPQMRMTNRTGFEIFIWERQLRLSFLLHIDYYEKNPVFIQALGVIIKSNLIFNI
jgi:hypothetical protein